MYRKIRVWDLPVRLFHWLLVVSLVAAWYTSEGERGLIEYHLLIGYFIFGLVIFRIIWGIWGTQYAKFTQFLPSPKSLIHYFRQTKNNSTYDAIGHNPIGGLMVVFMLAIILMQVISGLFMTDDVFTSGPYYESANAQVQKVMSFLHHNLFNVIIAISVIHIGAAFYYLLFKKVNLIKPMFTGYKLSKRVEHLGIKSSKLILAVIIIILVTVFLYWLLVLNVPIEEEYYF